MSFVISKLALEKHDSIWRANSFQPDPEVANTEQLAALAKHNSEVSSAESGWWLLE